MIAPTTFTTCSGLRITIDSNDVCSIEEASPEGTTEVVTAITYCPVSESVVFYIDTPIDEVNEQLAVAIQKARKQGAFEDGDEWKTGDDDASF